MPTMAEIRSRIVDWRNGVALRDIDWSSGSGARDIDWSDADGTASPDPDAFRRELDLAGLRDLAEDVRRRVVRIQDESLAAVAASRGLAGASEAAAAASLHDRLVRTGDVPEGIFAPEEIARPTPRSATSARSFACRAAVRRLLADPDGMEEKVSCLDREGGPRVLEALLEAKRHERAAEAAAEAFRLESARSFYVAEILAKASSPDCRMDPAALREHMRAIASSGSLADMGRVIGEVRNEIEAEENLSPSFG